MSNTAQVKTQDDAVELPAYRAAATRALRPSSLRVFVVVNNCLRAARGISAKLRDEHPATCIRCPLIRDLRLPPGELR